MENKNNNRVPTEQATHLISGMSNMETTNKTAEQFCKIHTEYHGEVIDSVKQIVQQTFTGKELMEFCEFYSTQQSKEKDERIKELEFANEEVRKKHDLARNVITDQDKEIKRLREVLTELIADIKADGYNYRLGTMDKVDKALNE